MFALLPTIRLVKNERRFILKVIFLDIDGVLNGYSKWTDRVFGFANKVHLRRWLVRHYDIFGVRTYKVWLLKRIIEKTDAKIVLSSSWRGQWNTPYEDCGPRMKILKRKFKRFGIRVYGVTGRSDNGKRESEIREWLSVHDKLSETYNDMSGGVIEKVESFVVLDDERSDLVGFIGKELVQTSEVDTIRGYGYENTGLKRKHVKKAIKILNGGDN